MLSLPVADTVGIEIEIQGLNQRSTINLLKNRSLNDWFSVHHDGSIDEQRVFIPELPNRTFSQNGTINMRLMVGTCGAEIISPPIDTTDVYNWKEKFEILFDLLRKEKEIISPKCSIHVHVNSSGLPIWSVKNVLKLWLQVEAPVYRLGIGESDIHRGELNKYLYCRPVRSPQVVKSRGGYRYAYDVDKMLNASNLREFFTAYGNVDINRDPNKYHPARYSAINFFSLNSIGTIEFRVFNEDLNVDHLFAWIDLSKSVIKQSMGKPIEFSDEVILGYSGNYDLYHMFDALELPDKSCLSLEGIWNKTTWPKFDGHSLHTHSSYNEILWDNKKFQPEKVRSFYMKEGNEFVWYNNLTLGDLD